MVRLEEIRIQNYKCFEDTDFVKFSTGLNLIVGPNNSGKTTFLRALSERISYSPRWRRSPTDEHWFREGPVVITRVVAGNPRDALRRHAENGDSPMIFEHPGAHDPEKARAAWLELIEEENVSFEARVVHRGPGQRRSASSIPTSYEKKVGKDGLFEDICQVNVEQDIENIKPIEYVQRDGSLGGLVSHIFCTRWLENVYSFSANRNVAANARPELGATLAPDCNNLASCLHNLAAGRLSVFQSLEDKILQLFPDFKGIRIERSEKGTTQNKRGGESLTVRLLLTPDDGPDAPWISLDDAGSGIGQVLAILYIILESQRDRVIIIDEPQTFLHPARSRAFAKLLIECAGQNQIIVSTHDASFIAAAHRASNIIDLRPRQGGSVAVTYGPDDMFSLSLALRQIGVAVEDIFGHTGIVWVEGPSDEEILQAVFERLGDGQEQQLRVQAMRNASKLKARTSLLVEVATLYETFPHGTLVPLPKCFVLDGDWSAFERNNLAERVQSPLLFLSEATIEGYLFDEVAIADVLSARLKRRVGAAEIVSKLEGFEDDGATDVKLKKLQWLWQQFDAGEYSKVQDGAALARWLLENDPSLLERLYREVRAAMAA